jgi:hypothetical protein
MARPERFELPTAWFVVLRPKRSNLLLYLNNNDILYPILFAYAACNALICGYLNSSIG